jgi:two-component system CheB/CheR fusion protein
MAPSPDRARIIQDLEEARDLAAAALDVIRHGLVVLDAELKIERANAWFYQRFQASPSDIVGRPFLALDGGRWDAPGLAQLLLEAASADRVFSDFELDREFSGAGRRVLVLSARALRPSAGDHPAAEAKRRVLLVIDDVTDARAAAEAREALARMERLQQAEASRLKDQFVATISHELRGPLSAIAAWVHVLLSGKSDRATQERALLAIDRGVKAESRLVDDLLDMSRILTGKLGLSQRLVDLVPIVESVVENAGPAAEAKQLEVHLRQGDSPAFVLGDPDRLQQIVWNLVSNAVKFTPRSGRIDVSLERSEWFWRIRVSDTGLGIPSSFLPHVFERFWQGEPGSTRRQPGLGLGLAIVRQLVELHGGDVTATSEGEGKGAAFTVRLPVPAVVGTADEVPAALAHGRPGQPRPAALADLRVLLVEDESDAREALAAVLQHYGASVKAAASAREGLAILTREGADVLVSDLGMPGEDGYDLIRRVRALPPEQGGRVPALALSAYASRQDHERALSAGFQAHVAKPVEASELVSRLLDLGARPPRGGG